MKAYAVFWHGNRCFCSATNAGQARMMIARSIRDAYGIKIGKLICEIECRRRQDLDYLADSKRNIMESEIECNDEGLMAAEKRWMR